jgi:hypothetical protein
MIVSILVKAVCFLISEPPHAFGRWRHANRDSALYDATTQFNLYSHHPGKKIVCSGWESKSDRDCCAEQQSDAAFYRLDLAIENHSRRTLILIFLQVGRSPVHKVVNTNNST